MRVFSAPFVMQIVEVIAEEEEGWFRGRLNNKEGVFPSNFVESNPVPAEPTPPPPEPGQNLTSHTWVVLYLLKYLQCPSENLILHSPNNYIGLRMSSISP